MFWLSRPPYLRWLLAATVVVGGIAVELLPSGTVRHPFTLEYVAIGQTVDEPDVVWREVPRGLLAPVALPHVVTRALHPGEPLLASVTTGAGGEDIPAGWWALEMDVPLGARPGMAVRLVTGAGTADGIVAEVRAGDFGERSGLVALPGDQADRVAPSVLDRNVVVLLGG
ncbi:MAG TPA: hypothetical protein VLB67_11945 [Acidimicrobiia bacterium]|nr:hypothetical protein [Acidimicrobiia bacterium]